MRRSPCDQLLLNTISSVMTKSNILLDVVALNYARMKNFSFFSAKAPADYRNVIWLINFQNIWLTWAEGRREKRRKIYFSFVACWRWRGKRNVEEKILFGVFGAWRRMRQRREERGKNTLAEAIENESRNLHRASLCALLGSLSLNLFTINHQPGATAKS
jgi:hypothetical protein